MSNIWNNQSIPFWGEHDIVDYGNKIVLIAKQESDSRSSKWPGSIPSFTEIFHELEISRTSYFLFNTSDDGRFYMSILSGRLILKTSLFKNKDGHYKLSLNKNNAIQFATIGLRQGFIARGVRIKHHGIFCVTPDNFRIQYESVSNFWSQGEYVNKLWSYKVNEKEETNKQSHGILEEIEETTEDPDCADACNLTLDTLEKYVEVSFEQEQLKAAQERPFYFTNFHSIPRKTSYKQFFKASIESEDYIRLTEQKPSLLQIRIDDAQTISVEVVDFEPDPGETNIVISSSGAQQIEANVIAQADQFYLDASPVIKNTLMTVVNNLREKRSPNKWLIPLASRCYEQAPNKKADMPSLENTTLNPSQKDGVQKGAGTQDYTLVLGPPGTGKTTVILQWVNYFVSQGKRILVTSQNNKAVDNVLERLAREKDLECIRVGNETKVSDSIRELLIDNYATNIQRKLATNLDIVYISLKEALDILKILNNNMQNIESKIIEKDILNVNLKNYNDEIIPILNDLIQKNESEKHIIESKIESYFTQLQEYTTKLSNLVDTNFLMKIFTSMKRKYYSILSADIESKKQKATKTLDAISIIIKDKSEERHASELKVQDISNKFNESLKEISSLLPSLPSSSLINANVYMSLYSMERVDETIKNTLSKDINRLEALDSILVQWKNDILGERQQSLYQTLLEFVDVVGATCIGINTNKIFSKIPFDVVIVDESGQIQLHNLIVPLSKSPKAILVGDHKQLPPIVSDELVTEIDEMGYETEWIEKSWFEMLWEQAPADRKAMLDTQFRCPAIISNFISDAFYENKYFAGKGMESKKSILSFCKSTMVFIDTSNAENNLETTRKVDGGRLEVLGNNLETEIITKLFELILTESPSIAEENELGIIVPYANHVVQIKKALQKCARERSLNLGNLAIKDLVASVDSYQGQERDIILFAFSRSNLNGTVGFLSDWRRLNVAMTRTKKQLVMIGNMNTLTKYIDGKKDKEFKLSMQKLREHLEENGQIIPATEFLNLTTRNNQ
jgi:superfamily I DNA and/or RNA helicase